MVDYVRLAATSERLIRKNGTEITFRKPNLTALDPLKPWNGPNPESYTEITLQAVFVPPNTVRQFGLTALGTGHDVVDLFSYIHKLFILFPGENDITQYPILIDQGLEFNLVAYQLLRPANNNLLAFVGARR
jgi:hypothetical protein